MSRIIKPFFNDLYILIKTCLTLEDEETIKIKDQTIIVKPVWKWMLE